MHENHCECQPIQGIKCGVKNCEYHDGTHYCEAGCIEVGPHYAATSGDTVCRTFKPKNIQ